MGFLSKITKQSSVNNFLEETISEKEIENILNEISTEETSKKLALSIAISYISNAISQCEFKTYEGNKPIKSQLYYLLNIQPNKNQNSSQFKNKLVNQLLINGEALVVERYNQFFVADSFNKNNNGFKEDTFSNITIDNDSIQNDIKANKAFYFKLDNDNITSLINKWNSNFGELLEYAVEKFKDNNSSKYKLLVDSMKAGEPDFEKKYQRHIKNQLKPFITKRTAVYPQFKGYDLQEFTKTGNTNINDVTGLKKEIFDTVSQAFKIPVQMMLGNVSNLNDVVNVFLTFAVDPIAQMISEEFTRKTTDYNMWSSGTKVKVDTSTIIHIDIFNNATDIDKLISSGYSNIDEVRKLSGQDELGTEFSKNHWITKNYAPIEDILNGEDQ